MLALGAYLSSGDDRINTDDRDDASEGGAR
jgi:hypothetical protein